MESISNPRALYFSYNWTSVGTDLTQGLHHVAQKSITTTFPFKSESFTLRLSAKSTLRQFCIRIAIGGRPRHRTIHAGRNFSEPGIAQGAWEISLLVGEHDSDDGRDHDIGLIQRIKGRAVLDQRGAVMAF